MISYSQNFEDVIINRLFKSKLNGFYIDVGSHDPVELSVTKFFYDLGWNGINIEPVPKSFKKLQIERPRDINLNLAIGKTHEFKTIYEIENRPELTTLDYDNAINAQKFAGGNIKQYTVEMRTLSDVCNQYSEKVIDFLKVDVEGKEKDVIIGANWNRFRPTLLVIEATVPCNIFDICGSKTNSSWEDWEPYILEAGYQLVYFDGLNRYYIRHEDSHLKNYWEIPISPILDNFILYSEKTKDLQIGVLDHKIKELKINLEKEESQNLEFSNEIVRLKETVNIQNINHEKEICKKDLITKLIYYTLIEERSQRSNKIYRKILTFPHWISKIIKNYFNKKEDISSTKKELNKRYTYQRKLILYDFIKNYIFPQSFVNILSICKQLGHKKNVVFTPDIVRATISIEYLEKVNWICLLYLPLMQEEWWALSKTDQIDRLKRIFSSEEWKKIKNNCLGFITFTQYHSDIYTKFIDVPIKSIKYPITENYNIWSYDTFKKNDNKKIVQIGWYMQRMHAIYMLPNSEYQKVYIINFSDYSKALFEKERSILKSKYLYFDFMENTVTVSDSIKTDEFLKLVTCNIGFVHYRDVAFPSFILQCISTCTPVLVNAHPIVVEYLGSDYPLFYYFYEDAIEKAMNENLILSAHEHLKKLRHQDEMSINYFVKQIKTLISGEK